MQESRIQAESGIQAEPNARIVRRDHGRDRSADWRSGDIGRNDLFSFNAVPQLVNFSGTLSDLTGKPMTRVEGVTFYLYPSAYDGRSARRWQSNKQ